MTDRPPIGPTGTVALPYGVVSVTVSVIVGGGVSWSLRSWAFNTIRMAMTIASAPRTPAAHSSAR